MKLCAQRDVRPDLNNFVHSTGTIRHFLRSLACFFLIVLSLNSIAAEKGGISLEAKDGVISLEVNQASIKSIFSVLHRETPIDFVVFDDLPDKQVSFQADILHLSLSGISVLLRDMALDNYAIAYNPTTSSMRVYVMPEGSEAPKAEPGELLVKRADFSLQRNITHMSLPLVNRHYLSISAFFRS
jgi:hypothetical protein